VIYSLSNVALSRRVVFAKYLYCKSSGKSNPEDNEIELIESFNNEHSLNDTQIHEL